MYRILTQFTTGGSKEAEIAIPISGPALPWSRANATPVPDVKAQRTPIHRDRTFPLNIKIHDITYLIDCIYNMSRKS